MAPKNIDHIRERIRLGHYDMTLHGMEEMAEDDLDILDLEQSILYGRITRIEKDDPRGTKYVIQGPGIDDQISLATVGRFTDDRYLVITVYAITD